MEIPRQRGTSTTAITLALSLVIAIYSSTQAESLTIGERFFVQRSNIFRFSRHVGVVRSTNNIDNIPINSDVPSDANTRRRRKNKYENFSRVEVDSDPLESLLEESKRMNQDLLTGMNSSKQKSKIDALVEIPSIPNKVFPDVKTINVSSTTDEFIILILVFFSFALLQRFSRTIRKRLDIC